MEDNHSRLTSEVSNLIELLADTKYGNKEKHPVVHAAIGRIKKALKVFGRKAISVAGIKSSEEVRSTIFDKELEPLISRINELTSRYQMPALVAIEWGDNGKTAVMCQPTAVNGGLPCEKMKLAMLASDSGGDLDVLFSKLLLLAKMEGHQSKVLDALGVPREPETEKG